MSDFGIFGRNGFPKVEAKPEPPQLKGRILAAFKRKNEKKRYYLGCSSLGDECERSAWYQYRHISAPNFSDRMEKLLDHGHKEEARHRAAFRRAGIEMYGDQHSVSALGGILKGHTDGFAYIDHAMVGSVEIEDEVLLWEMKTGNKNSFADISNKVTKTGSPRAHGVKAKKPQHYAQMQLYMGLSGAPGDARALYTMSCKDNDDIYLEVVPFNQEYFDELMARAERVATGPITSRPYKNPEFFKCRFCDAKEVCWGEENVPVICGSCSHWTVDINGGRTLCALTGNDARQDESCVDHAMIPELEQNQKTFVFWT